MDNNVHLGSPVSNLDKWKGKGHAALRDFFQRLPSVGEATSKAVMYGATAAVLLPLLQLGREPATITLWQFLISTGAAVGQNLIASWIERFYDARDDEGRLAELIEHVAQESADLRTAIAALEKEFSFREIIVGADLSEQAKQRFTSAIHAELQAIAPPRVIPWDRSTYLRSLAGDEKYKRWEDPNYIRLHGMLVGHNVPEDLQSLIKRLACPGCLVIVEGEPGAGKTTVLERLLFELALAQRESQDMPSRPLLPVFIRMDHYVGTGDLRHLFASALSPAAWSMLSDSDVEALMRDLDLFVLIDGLDQLRDARWSCGYAALWNYLERSQRHRRVLAWRGEDPDITAAFEAFGAKRILIQPLGEDQIREYLKQRLGDTLGGELDAELKADLIEVVRNPLILSLLTEVIEKEPPLTKELYNRGALLEHIIYRTIEHNRYGMVQEDRNVPRPSVLARMLAYLAWAVRHEQRYQCDERKICRILKERLEKDELGPQHNVRTVLKWLLKTHWLQREDDLIVFRHPYIMDALTAMEWKARFNEEGSETALGYVAPVMPRSEWQEVVVLLAGMLDCGNASLLVESLIEQNLKSLAVRCVLEGTNVRRATLARVIHALLAQPDKVERQ